MLAPDAAILARFPWAREFICFGIVGLAGFFVNVGTVYALRPLLGLYLVGFAAYGTAATVTWLMNSAWTFRGRGTTSPCRQWLLFLAANTLGFALYYATYAASVALSPLCRAYPVVAVFCGTAAGFLANFLLSRTYVFR